MKIKDYSGTQEPLALLSEIRGYISLTYGDIEIDSGVFFTDAGGLSVDWYRYSDDESFILEIDETTGVLIPDALGEAYVAVEDWDHLKSYLDHIYST